MTEVPEPGTMAMVAYVLATGRKAAQRSRLRKGEWVRRVLHEAAEGTA